MACSCSYWRFIALFLFFTTLCSVSNADPFLTSSSSKSRHMDATDGLTPSLIRTPFTTATSSFLDLPVGTDSMRIPEGVEMSIMAVDAKAREIGEAVTVQLAKNTLKQQEGVEDDSSGGSTVNGPPTFHASNKRGRILVALTELSHRAVNSKDRKSEEAFPSHRLSDLEAALQQSKVVMSSSLRESGTSSPESIGAEKERSESLSLNKHIRPNSEKQVVRSYQILENVGIVVVDFHPDVTSTEVAETVRGLWFDHPEVWLIEADTQVTFRDVGEDTTETVVVTEALDEKVSVSASQGIDVGQRETSPELDMLNPRQTARAPNDRLFAQQWALDNRMSRPGVDVRAVPAWSLIYDAQGKRKASLPDAAKSSVGMKMGHIDTGCDVNHPDLRPNIWTNPREIPGNGKDDDGNGYVDDIHGWNFDADTSDVTDEHGHGTHTAGIMSAASNNLEGVSGLFWDSKIVVLKFKNDVSDAVRAVEYCLANDIVISTNSWGFNTPVESLRLVLDRANKWGHLFICAVDNKGRDNTWFNDFPPNYPFPNMIRVASITSQADLDVTSDFSKTKVDVAAPGKGVLSTVPYSVYGKLYGFKDGTSMATPLVAGLAGLLRSLNPNMSIYKIRDTILNTVTPLTAIQDRIRTGGIINCENAVRMVLGMPFPPPVAIDVLPENRAPMDLFGGAGQVSELLFAGFNDFMNGFLTRTAKAAEVIRSAIEPSSKEEVEDTTAEVLKKSEIENPNKETQPLTKEELESVSKDDPGASDVHNLLTL